MKTIILIAIPIIGVILLFALFGLAISAIWVDDWRFILKLALTDVIIIFVLRAIESALE